MEKYTCGMVTISGLDEWVRVLGDDAVVNLSDCQEPMPGGFCSLQSFIQHQLKNDWNDCFGLEIT